MALTQKQFLDAAGLQAFWNKTKAYINVEDAKVTTATDTKINGLEFKYNTADKTITLKNGTNTIGTVDATDFIKDSFLQDGKLVEVDGEKVLRLTLLTVERPGATGTTSTVDINVNDLFKVAASNITLTDGTTVEKAVTDLKAEDTAIKNAATTLATRVTALEGTKDDYKAADATLKGEIETAYKAADKEVYDSITAIPEASINALFETAGA